MRPSVTSQSVIFGSVGMLRFAVSRHLLALCQAVSFQGHLALQLVGFLTSCALERFEALQSAMEQVSDIAPSVTNSHLQHVSSSL